jgi:hypothetical protein
MVRIAFVVVTAAPDSRVPPRLEVSAKADCVIS